MTIKKISALLMLSVLPLGVLTAQEAKDYLPKAGDWAIGIDMQPVYRFFGNMANGSGTAAATVNNLGQFGGEDAIGYTGNVTLMGKYMLDNTTAIRVNLGVQKNKTHDYSYSRDDNERFINPLSEAKVKDLQITNTALYSLAAGIEFRKGKDRIQGYYGADLVLGMQKNYYQFEYGNAITEINQLPSRTAYAVAGATVINPGYWSSGYLTEYYRNNVLVGIAGKLGVEYFVVPKLAFGGEVSLLINETFTKARYTKSEGYNPTTAQVETHTELEAPKDRTFHIGTQDMGGKLFMIFYF